MRYNNNQTGTFHKATANNLPTLHDFFTLVSRYPNSMTDCIYTRTYNSLHCCRFHIQDVLNLSNV
jgi:hypothetical protein